MIAHGKEIAKIITRSKIFSTICYELSATLHDPSAMDYGLSTIDYNPSFPYI